MNEKEILRLLIQKKIINSCGFENFGSMYAAYASYGAKKHPNCTANAVSRKNPLEAEAKAAIEAYERYCCERYSYDLIATAESFDDLDFWVDPRVYAPLNRKQARKGLLEPFSEREPICWCNGYFLAEENGEIVPSDVAYVPQDMVYYGRARTIYRANSSGVAAHYSEDLAIVNAVAELIERDAIIRTYLSKKGAMVIPDRVLPDKIHRQKAILESSEYTHKNVYMLCLQGYIPTALVVVTDHLYPHIATGASASFVSFEDALQKALDEAEYNYNCYLKMGPHTISKRHIVAPEDHGLYYARASHTTNISWLWSGQVLEFMPENTKTITEAVKDLSIIAVPLAIPGVRNSIPLYVFRVLSHKLIPISFGYDMIHYDHPSIDFEIAKEAKKEPHFFA